jgi:hypothetical protein
MTCSCCVVEHHGDPLCATPGFAFICGTYALEQAGDLCLDLPIPLANQCGVALVKMASISGPHRVSDNLLDFITARVMVANLLEAYDVNLTTVWTPCPLPISSTTTMSPALLCMPLVPVPVPLCLCAPIVPIRCMHFAKLTPRQTPTFPNPLGTWARAFLALFYHRCHRCCRTPPRANSPWQLTRAPSPPSQGISVCHVMVPP